MGKKKGKKTTGNIHQTATVITANELSQLRTIPFNSWEKAT